MPLPEPVETARHLVTRRFPEARQAWLSGSVVLGRASATSDLDVTVLLAGPPAPYRESLEYAGWPVELFVHTADSVLAFVAKDRARRRPSMARLVSTGVPLLPGGEGAELAASCAAEVARGPDPLTPGEQEAARYALTDLLDDLAGGGPPEVQGAVAVATWQATAELLLAVAGRWSGTGKWLVRELQVHDQAAGTAYAARLHDALRAALGGDAGPLTAVAQEVLDRAGGRLWVGYRATPTGLPDRPDLPPSPRSVG